MYFLFSFVCYPKLNIFCFKNVNKHLYTMKMNIGNVAIVSWCLKSNVLFSLWKLMFCFAVGEVQEPHAGSADPEAMSEHLCRWIWWQVSSFFMLLHDMLFLCHPLLVLQACFCFFIVISKLFCSIYFWRFIIIQIVIV